jgi:hypothetical protein
VCCGGLAAALQAARLRGPTNKVRVAMRAMSPKIIKWLAVDAQKLTASKHANALMQFPHNRGGRARGFTLGSMHCRRQGCVFWGCRWDQDRLGAATRLCSKQ